MAHLEEHQILTDRQHGFRARRIYGSQLLTLCHELVETIGIGYQMDLVILDFAKRLLTEYPKEDSWASLITTESRLALTSGLHYSYDNEYSRSSWI